MQPKAAEQQRQNCRNDLILFSKRLAAFRSSKRIP